MARYRRMEEGADGWCEWVQPVMEGYKMSCCDCGLVHNLNFRVVRLKDDETGKFTYRVQFKASRNKRSTALARRHRKASPCSPA